MKMIVCADKNMGIGKNGSLPWKNKDDLRWFKEFTLDQSLLMGRTTYENLGVKFLPKRMIYVLSSNPQGAIYIPNENTGYEYISEDQIPENSIICGGRTVYEKMMSKTTELYMTILDDSFECDTFFPYSLDQIEKMFNTKEVIKTISGGTILKYSK